MFKRLSLLFLLIIIIITLSGCTNILSGSKPSLEEKVDEEVEYMESEIIAMLNSLNGIIYTNYKVVPTGIKQSNIISNTNSKLGQTSEDEENQKKDTLETSGESIPGAKEETGQLRN